MTRQIKSARAAQLTHLRMAMAALRQARYHLIEADSPKTLARVRKAITSAGGAERHMIHRLQRSAR